MRIEKTKKARKLIAACKLAERRGAVGNGAEDFAVTTTKQLGAIRKMTALERRAELASLLPRGYSHAELALQLKKKGFCDTGGKPLSEAIIKADIAALEGYWKEVCAETVDKHRARQLMELTRLKTAAYDGADLELVLKILSKEIDLLGTKVAVKEVGGNASGTTIFDFRHQAISVDQRDKLAMDVLESARKRVNAPDNADKNSVDAAAQTA